MTVSSDGRDTTTVMIRFHEFSGFTESPISTGQRNRFPHFLSGLARFLVRINDCIMTVVTGYDIYRVNVMTDMDPDTHV